LLRPDHTVVHIVRWLLTRLVAIPAPFLKEARVCFLPGFEIHVGKRDASGSIKKESVPAKTKCTAELTVPCRLVIALRTKLGLGGGVLLFGKKKEFVRLEFFINARGMGPIPGEAAFHS